MDNDIIIRVVNTSDAIYPQVYDLREEVLRKPIGLSLANEDLSNDVKDDIVIAEQDGMVLGCIMLQKTDDPQIIKFRQMAVQQKLQRGGVGKLIMKAAEEQAWHTGHNKITLHARTSAEDFYKKLGYQTISNVFTEVGIPHVVMQKQQPHG